MSKRKENNMDENKTNEVIEDTTNEVIEPTYVDSTETSDEEGGLSGAATIALGAAAVGAIGAGAIWLKKHGKKAWEAYKARQEEKAEQQKLEAIAEHIAALKELGVEIPSVDVDVTVAETED